MLFAVCFTVNSILKELDGTMLDFYFQIFLAVAIPIVAFFILVIIISVIMRRLHRKRMEKLAASSGKHVFRGLQTVQNEPRLHEYTHEKSSIKKETNYKVEILT